MKKRRRGNGLRSLPLRKLALWGIGILAGFLLLVVAGYFQLLSYLQGESFRDTLEKVLANKARAESVNISGTLNIDSNRLSLRGISIRRPGMLKELTARGVHAEIRRSALWDRELHLTRLSAEEGTLVLNTGLSNQKLPHVQKGSSGILSGIAPVRARLDRFNCNNFNTSLRLDGKDYQLSSSSLEATPAPKQGKNAWEFRLNNGRLHNALPILGDSGLKSAIITWGGKVTSVSDARLMLSPGELIVNAMQDSSSKNWTADLRVNKMNISRLLRDDWKKRLSGELYGQLDAEGNAGGITRAEGRLSLQQGLLEALPILAKLPVGNTHPYRSLQLERAEATLSYPYADESRNIRQAWLLDNIDVQGKDGMLRVTGHVMVDADKTLAGTLHIGLPANIATLLAPPGTPLHSNIFNTPTEGDGSYLWLRLNLSGTLDDPQEDLSARLLTLLGGNIAKTATNVIGNLFSAAGQVAGQTSGSTTGDNEGGEDTAAPEEEDETDAPSGAIKGAGEAAQDILNTGLRSFF